MLQRCPLGPGQLGSRRGYGMIAEPPVKAESASAFAGGELRKLALHSSHYLAGLLGGLIVGLVSFPIFTRAFSVAEYGLLDLAQRVVLILTIASKAGLQNAVLRFYDKDLFTVDRRAAKEYYSTLYLGALSTAAGIAVCFLAAIILFRDSLNSGPLGRLASLIMVLVVLRAAGAILWGFLRIEERTAMFNVTSVATKAATVLAICVLMGITGVTARTYFIGVVGVEALLVAGLTTWLWRRQVLDTRTFNMTLLRSGVGFGLPLVAYELAFAVLGSADRVLVRHYLGADALGFYSVASGLAQHANDLLVSPLILAILPIYLNIWNTSGAARTVEFLNLALDLFLMAAACVLSATVVASRDIVVLLASSKYAGVDRFVPLLLAGFLVYATYVFFAAGMLIEKRTVKMAGLLGIAAGVNIALNCLLLPLFGLTGSAAASLASYALCVAMLSRGSRAFVPVTIDGKRLTRYAVAAALAALASFRLDFGSAAANIVSKGSLCIAVYAAVLWVLDPRVRSAARWTACAVRARI
jgi:O-antigen/teichoic acid export membrane protein